jgi:hypothetical protein
MHAPIRESDLYAPVKGFLERSGYEVRGEVADCDLAAIRGEELVVVELKRVFGLKLLMQAVNRQKAADSVYVAIPKPPRGRFSKSFWDMCHILRRLEIGLLTVTFRDGEATVDVALHPPASEPESRGVRDGAPAPARRRNSRMRRSIIREFTGRSGDYNTGGSSKRGLVTAYRESAVRVACFLDKCGPLSAAELKTLGTGEKTYGILYRNVYGWFERSGAGRYALHDAGRSALAAYPDLCARYRKELRGARRPSVAGEPRCGDIGRRPSAPVQPPDDAGRRAGRAPAGGAKEPRSSR